MSINAMLQEQNHPEQYQHDFSSMEYIGADRYNLSEFERTNLTTTWKAAWRDIQGQLPNRFWSITSKSITVPMAGLIISLMGIAIVSRFDIPETTSLIIMASLAIGIAVY
jgi:hypothetical protein